MTKKELQKKLELSFTGWVRIEDEKTNVFDNEWQRQIDELIAHFENTFKIANIIDLENFYISNAYIYNGMLSYRINFYVHLNRIVSINFITYHCSTDYEF